MVRRWSDLTLLPKAYYNAYFGQIERDANAWTKKLPCTFCGRPAVTHFRDYNGVSLCDKHIAEWREYLHARVKASPPMDPEVFYIFWDTAFRDFIRKE